MALAALDSVDDALAATKRFLLPFDRVRWFRLAVVMFFIGGAGASFPNVPTFGFDFPVDGGPDPGPGPGGPAAPDVGQFEPTLTGELLVLIVGVLVLAVGLFLLWNVVGAVMEFVFVRSLGDEEVRLWTYFTRNWWRGVRLFGFRLAVWLLTFGAVGAVLVALVATAVSGPIGEAEAAALFGIVLLAIPLLLVALVVTGTLLGFTTMFVVPVMLAEDRGVLSAWRRFWGTLTGNVAEYAVYLVLSILLGIGIGIVAGVLSLVALLVLAIPFALVGVPVGLVVGLNAIGGSILLVLALLYAVLALATLLLIKVPFQTFLRYYALFVLGDTNPAFDVIPDTRAAVRADGGDDIGSPPSAEGTDGSGESGGPGDGGPRSEGVDDATDDPSGTWEDDRDEER